MRITRRTLMMGGAALVAAPALPVWAADRIEFGDMRIETLSDGHLVQPASLVVGEAPKAGAEAILEAHGLSTERLEPPCNVTLLRRGADLVLFDLGAGPDFMPTAGKLHETLAALGVGAEEITHVIFTHGHPDHLWGLLDGFDEPVFPNATHMMGQVEFDFWRDPGTEGRMPAGREVFALGAKRRLDLLADRIEMVRDGQEVLPGVMAHVCAGHTPGHMCYELRDGSGSVMVLGDAIANAHIAFEQPLWPSGIDQDAQAAARTRARLLDRLASDKMAFIGYHLPGGGLGRAERSGSGYKFSTEI